MIDLDKDDCDKGFYYNRPVNLESENIKNRSLRTIFYTRKYLFQLIHQSWIDQAIYIHFSFINPITDIKLIDVIG